MRKYFLHTLIISFVLFSISIGFFPSVQAAETRTVTATGISDVFKDKARARDEALRDAYRMALEKAGVNISAYTEMVMGKRQDN